MAGVFQPRSTALITGGSSGIGFAVAELCLSHEMRVAIVDINKETLDIAVKALKDKGDITTFQADVGRLEEWKRLKGEVDEWAKNGVDFLMLNAGVVRPTGTWGDSDYFEKILSTNLFGVIHGLNTFVPSFQARTESSSPSAIVITGSKQGITNPPGHAAYNASKAAVKTLAEHLSYDLRESSTAVHLLVPGWTFTGMSGNTPTPHSTPKPAGAWTPAQVADYLFEHMKAGKFYVICPDNDVSEETDKKRMLWSVGDVVDGRPPLTRWRPEWKERAEGWMGGVDVKGFEVEKDR